jgi:hypothetical protein
MRSQVHVKVEAFTAGELAVRAQQEGVANLRPDEAEDANEARLPVSCQASWIGGHGGMCIISRNSAKKF